MGNKPVDPAPYAEALRAADPRLREPPAGPVARSQPSRLDTLREARFAAYRRRADVRAPAANPGPQDAGAAAAPWREISAARKALRRPAR